MAPMARNATGPRSSRTRSCSWTAPRARPFLTRRSASTSPTTCRSSNPAARRSGGYDTQVSESNQEQSQASTETGGGPSSRQERPRRRSGGGGGGGRFGRRRVCAFCVDKVESIDYKDPSRLRRYISDRGKIEPRRKSGTCARHQRMLTTALKRARHLALLPYSAEHIHITGIFPS